MVGTTMIEKNKKKDEEEKLEKNLS